MQMVISNEKFMQRFGKKTWMMKNNIRNYQQIIIVKRKENSKKYNKVYSSTV